MTTSDDAFDCEKWYDRPELKLRSFLSLFLGDSFFSIVLLISLLSLFLIFLVYEIGLNQNERKKIVEFIKTKIDR